MTGLGVFWGTFLFTVLMGFGLWLGRTSTASLTGYSLNTVYFVTGQTSIPYKGMPSGRWWDFDMDDVESIKKHIPEVKYIGTQKIGDYLKVSYEQRKGEYLLMGYNPEYQKINPVPIRFGRFINEPDMAEKRKVCVIGEQIWNELFPGGENPVGATIKVNHLYLNVIGVMGDNSLNLNASPLNSIAVPITLVQQIWNSGNSVNMINIMAQADVRIQDIEDECRRIIASNHIVSPEDKKAIYSFNLGDQVEKVNGLLGGISFLTWVVGLGTLLAGIVGVSNIMLVIVRERTQEIGVRRAIGAKPKSIIAQILSESFVLTFIAGILGLTAGVAALSLLDKILRANMGEEMQQLQISFGLGIGSTLIIIAGSLLAGVIPALRALKIKAVDAIREE